MKSIIRKFTEMPSAKKIQCVTAAVLAVVLIAAITAYAWFVSQKRAAEMYKVQYANALYVNAAHREDQIYFELDAVNVNEFERDANGNVIYYTDSSYTVPKIKEVDGVEVYDETGVAHVITSQKYVFSVLGSNTETFQLQLAYTNNNQFRYTIYPAEELTEAQFSALTPAPANVIARPAQASGAAHTISGTFFSSDLEDKDKSETYYYVQGLSPLEGSYLNTKEGNLLAKTDDAYYKGNYGTNTNVEGKSVPIYWHSVSDIEAELDVNKRFCKYYILEVTWDSSRNAEKKETDMIAITVQRTG